MPTKNKVLHSTRVTAHCSFFFFQYVCAQSLSHAQLFVTTWTVAHQVPLSMEFPRQEYWIGLSFPTPGDLPDPGTEPTPLVPPALAVRFFTTAPPGKPALVHVCSKIYLRISE